MPLVHTFINIIEEGDHAEALLDDLQHRLAGRAVVGRLPVPPEWLPVVFFEDPPIEEQHAAVVAALNAIDRWAEREEGDWRRYLGVEE